MGAATILLDLLLEPQHLQQFPDTLRGCVYECVSVSTCVKEIREGGQI